MKSLQDKDIRYLDHKRVSYRSRTESTLAKLLSFLDNQFEYDVALYKEMKLEEAEKVKVKDISGKKIRQGSFIWIRQMNNSICAVRSEHAHEK